jgi:tetratricopeptide (TPR) repeat protein
VSEERGTRAEGRIQRSLKLALLTLVFGLSASLAGPPALAAQDSREAKGRAFFATGEYQSALDVYVTLFGDRGDPVYLRNIGRCYQKLRRPDKAIDSFQEYLRRYPKLKPSERREVETFIEEMKKLKAEQESAASAPRSPDRADADEPRSPVSPVAAPVAASNLRTIPANSTAVTGTKAAPLVIANPDTAPEAPPDESKPLTRRWWFWAGMGGVLIAGAVAAAVILGGGGTTRPDCPPPYTCTH